MAQRLDYMKLAPQAAHQLIQASTAIGQGFDHTILNLVKVRASQLNGCAFCTDMHIKEAIISGETQLRLHHLVIWHESPLFSERERQALQLTERLTKTIADHFTDEEFKAIAAHFTDEEMAYLVLNIGMINAWNRLGVAFASVPGSLDKVFGLEKAGLA